MSKPAIYRNFFELCRTAIKTLKQPSHVIQRDLARRATVLQTQSGEPGDEQAASASKLSKETYIKYLRHKAGVVEGKQGGEDESQDRRRDDPRLRRPNSDGGGSRSSSSSGGSSRDVGNSYSRGDRR